jgi:2-oxoisovalerate ferredoxin oxidoreductase alpha subunit
VNPFSIGNLPTAEEHYMLRKNIWDCIEYSKKVFRKVGKEFGDLSGRDYSDPLPSYMIDDADYIIVSIGAMAGDAEDAVDKLRDKGIKVGSIAVRLLRPFPREEFIQKIADAKYIAVFNRGVSMGMGGVITGDIRYTIGSEGVSKDIYDIIVGIGGVEVSYEDYAKVVYDMINGKLEKNKTYFVMGGEYV